MVMEETPQHTVLVVDDEPTILDVVGHMERLVRSTSAADGAEALRMVTWDRPDLVVLDLMPPGIDGIEVGHESCTVSRARGSRG